MNVLMFTMTMIFLLATMTYARLDTFLSHQIIEIEIQRYIEKSERLMINLAAKETYEKTVVNPQTPNSPNTPNTPRTGTSKLSWSIFLDQNERDKDPSKYKQVAELTKKVILNLFSEQETVNKMIENNPDILDRLFTSVMNAVNKLPPEMKIKKIAQISSVDLQDEELNLLRYELFKENSHVADAKEDTFLKNKNKETYSLLDQLTTEAKPTRFYLASKVLLKSIFNQDMGLVDQVITKRQSLHAEVKTAAKTNADATSEFKAFLKSIYPYINDSHFDYSVTKTDPKKYE